MVSIGKAIFPQGTSNGGRHIPKELLQKPKVFIDIPRFLQKRPFQSSSASFPQAHFLWPMLIQVPARLQSYLQDLGVFKPPLPTTFRLSLLCHSQRWLAVPCSALAYPCFVPPPLPDRQSY